MQNFPFAETFAKLFLVRHLCWGATRNFFALFFFGEPRVDLYKFFHDFFMFLHFYNFKTLLPLIGPKHRSIFDSP